jgi:uncharacterized Zn-finger protein
MVSDQLLGAAIARLVRTCRPGELSAKRIRYALEDEFACGDLAARIDFIRDQIQRTLSTMENAAALLAPSSAHAQSRSSSSSLAAEHDSKKRDRVAPDTLPNSASNRNSLPASEKSSRFQSKFAKPLRRPTFAGRKAFACDNCEWSFDDKSGLIKHQLVHSNVRPFLCDQCGCRFSRKINLQSHRRNRHGAGRPY